MCLERGREGGVRWHSDGICFMSHRKSIALLSISFALSYIYTWRHSLSLATNSGSPASAPEQCHRNHAHIL